MNTPDPLRASTHSATLTRDSDQIRSFLNPAPTVIIQKPDPSTPGPQTRPSALTAASTTALAGTPLAIISVLLAEHLINHPLDSVTATAIGSVGAALAGYLFRVVQALLLKAGIDPGE